MLKIELNIRIYFKEGMVKILLYPFTFDINPPASVILTVPKIIPINLVFLLVNSKSCIIILEIKIDYYIGIAEEILIFIQKNNSLI